MGSFIISAMNTQNQYVNMGENEGDPNEDPRQPLLRQKLNSFKVQLLMATNWYGNLLEHITALDTIGLIATLERKMNNPREEELGVSPINEEEKTRMTNHQKKNLKRENELANNTTRNHESSRKLEQTEDKIK